MWKVRKGGLPGLVEGDSLDHSSRKRPSLGGHTGHHAHRNGIVDDGDSNDADDAARDCAKGRLTLVSDRGWRSWGCLTGRTHRRTPRSLALPS